MIPENFARRITRLGAGGLIISGAALGYSYVSHPHLMTPAVIAGPGWVIIHALFALSLVLGLMATVAVYASTALHSGWTGLVGCATLFVGMMMIFGLDYYGVFVAPYLARHYPSVIVDHGAGDAMGAVALAFPVAGFLTVSGYALLGWAWLRAEVYPRSVMLALILTSIAFGIGLSPIGGLMTARITAAGFGAALISVGFAAWRNSDAQRGLT